MDRIQEIIDRLKAIDARQEAIETEVKDKLDNKFTDELRDEHDTLTAEYDELKAEKETLEADQQRFANRQNRDGDFRANGPRFSNQNSGDPAPPSDDKPPVWATARQSRSLRNFRGERNGVSAEERAYSFGAFCLHALSQDIPRFNCPQNISDYVTNRFRNALHQSNDATGFGHLVPEEFGMDLVVLRETYGVARRTFRVLPMSGDTRSDPRWSSGLTAYFVSEGSAGTTSSGVRDRVKLTAKDLMVLTTMSSQLSSDAAIDIGDQLAGDIAYAFANKEDDCAFNGDGTSTYGGIQGVRSKLQDVDGAGTDSAGLVTQGTGTTWAAIVLADFNNVVGTLPQYADTNNAAWVCHKTFYHSVMQKLELAAGGVTANEIASGDRRPRPMFLGYPVDFSQVFPSTTAVTTVSCTFGDHALAARFGDRQQESIMFSEHATVNSENVFEQNEIAVRGTERFDINVHDAGDASNAGPVVGLQTGT